MAYVFVLNSTEVGLGYVTRLMILGQKFALSRVSLYRVESVPSGEYP